MINLVFQSGKSTTDCIFLLNASFAKTQKQNLYCCFIDFEKCFDKIDRFNLWQNISTCVVKAFQSMYNTVKFNVKLVSKNASEISDCFESLNGVKEGDPSSSLLFLLFINDIVQNINSDIDGLFTVELFILLFADDTVPFAQTPAALQSMLNDLEHYCTHWGLKINTKETKIMIFERGRNTFHAFFLSGNRLDNVESFKYLGICFYKNGSFYRTQKKLAEHSLPALHKLFLVFNQLDLSVTDKCRLFDSLVGSLLNYSAPAWGCHNSKDIEIVHNKFLRKLLSVKKSTWMHSEAK